MTDAQVHKDSLTLGYMAATSKLTDERVIRVVAREIFCVDRTAKDWERLDGRSRARWLYEAQRAMAAAAEFLEGDLA